MNERQRAILTLLIKFTDYKIGDLEKELGLTRRQINYSLDQFNDLLLENKIPTIKRNKIGDFFIPSEVIQMLSNNNEIKIPEYEFISDSERRDILLMYLILANHFISLNHIIDLSFVSKTTAIKDIKHANEYIKQYGLNIEYNRDKGYKIYGKERKIRDLLNDLIVLWGNKLESNMLLSDYLYFKEDIIIHFVSEVEHKLEVKYSSESFKLLVKLLGYTLTRIKLNDTVDEDFQIDEVKKTKEFKVINELISKEWSIKSRDIEWITLIFLSSNIYKNESQVIDDSQLEKLINDMVGNFETKTLINIEDRFVFIQRLYAHMRPAIYRIKYGLSLERYNINSIINDQKHSILLSLIKDLIKPIEKELETSFPPEELQLLSLYFGSQLESKEETIKGSLKAVTVCANGLISSRMMKKTLEKLFPEFVFLSSVSEREFYDYEVDYDVVFSTTMLKTHIQQFHVNTIMSDEEQIRLRYNVLKKFEGIHTLDNVDKTVKELLLAIDKYSTINNRNQLKKNIKDIILSNTRSEIGLNNDNNPNLKDYIKSEFITKIEGKLEWEEVIELAAKPLLERNCINKDYIKRIIEMIRTTDYMYLGKYLTIPHAESKNDIFSESMGLLVSEQGIEFPNNKTIHLIVPIAIVDTTKHLQAMNQLSDLALNEELINKLKDMSEMEIYKQIKKVEVVQ